MSPRKPPVPPTRSPKAPGPPDPTVTSPQARRRVPSAKAVVRKGDVLDAAGDTRARWPGARPKFKKK